jgi:hypothetical protein
VEQSTNVAKNKDMKELKSMMPDIITRLSNNGTAPKAKEVTEKVEAAIERLLNKRGGILPTEAAADMCNRFGSCLPHFTFDIAMPLSKAERTEHNAYMVKPEELEKITMRIRSKEKNMAKKKWEVNRRDQLSRFLKVFFEYMATQGEHKENKLGIKFQVGDSIKINTETGHYSRLYSIR